MTDQKFPSGPWAGFYNYGPGDRHRMRLHLTFANGGVTGDGDDDVGRFAVNGRYNADAGECYWTKTYFGAHDVYYRGFREGKGIWGTWEIGIFDHGGFHIWPLQAGETETDTAGREAEELIDVKGIEVSQPATETASGALNFSNLPTTKRILVCERAEKVQPS